MQKCFLSFLLLLLLNSGYAQTSSLDELPLDVLRQKLAINKEDTIKVQLQLALGHLMLFKAIMCSKDIEKGTVNPWQAITSSTGPLTYAIAAGTKFDWSTWSTKWDENASVSTVAVSTVFNIAAMHTADGLMTSKAPIPVIGITTTIFSLWGDGTNSIIHHTPIAELK